MVVAADWAEIHEEIETLGKERARRDHTLGRALLRARRGLVWQPLGIGTFVEYAERHLGLSPRQSEDRVRVAEALESLPLLDAELASGELHFTAVREITRVATPETEELWRMAGRERTVGEIEKLVAGRKPGDRPEDPAGPTRRKLTFEVSPAVYALFRDASAALRREVDEPLDEEDVLMLMARRVLGGPGDEGRSSYQILMTMCSRCGQAEQDGRGEAVVVEPEVAAAAECDAQRVDEAGHVAQDIPPATRRLVMRRHHGGCGVTGCRNASYVDIHHVVFRSDGGTHDPERLIVLCGAHHDAVHRGALRIEGTWSAGFRFLRADGGPYGTAGRARLAGVFADVVSALRNMGWKDRDVQAMVDAVSPHVGGDVTFADALKMALRGASGLGFPHTLTTS